MYKINKHRGKAKLKKREWGKELCDEVENFYGIIEKNGMIKCKVEINLGYVSEWENTKEM